MSTSKDPNVSKAVGKDTVRKSADTENKNPRRKEIKICWRDISRRYLDRFVNITSLNLMGEVWRARNLVQTRHDVIRPPLTGQSYLRSAQIIPSFEETTTRMAIVFCAFEEKRNINKRNC